MGLVEKYQDRRFADRVFDLAWTHSQVVLQQLNVTESDAQLYGRLAGSMIYAEFLFARRHGHSQKKPSRAIRSVGIRRFPGSADRAAAD